MWYELCTTHRKNSKVKSKIIAWSDYSRVCNVSSYAPRIRWVSFGIKGSQTSQVGKHEHAVFSLLTGFLDIQVQFFKYAFPVAIQSLKSCLVELYVKV